MRTYIKILYVALLFLLFSSAAFAAVRFVRDDGSNSNWPCTTNSAGGACLTIDYAADNVSAGDTIRVQAGTYEENITPSVSGTSSSAMVTFVADGAVIFRGITLTGQDYQRYIGFDIDNAEAASRAIVNTGDSDGLEFWNNIIQDATTQCVYMTGAVTDSIFIGNDIKDCNSTASGQAISLANYSHVLVAYNEISDIDPDVFFVQGSYGRYLNNYSHDMLEGGAGHPDFFQNGNATPDWSWNLYESNFQLGAGSGSPNEHFSNFENPSGATMTENIFRRNVIHNIGSGGFGAHTANPGMTDIRWYNNTTAQPQRAATTAKYAYAAFNGAYTPMFILNNIEYESWGTSSSTDIQGYCVSTNSGCLTGVTLTLDYNLAYDPDGDVTFASLWSDQSNSQDNKDPDFNDYGNDDFTLGSSSNATNNGTCLATTDGGGTGDTFDVQTNEGGYFRGDDTDLDQYGGNLVVGDVIMVGADEVRISSISGDAITVTGSFTWTDSEDVCLGTDTTPDIGAYPYKAGGYALTATYVLSAGTVTVTPSDADLVRMVVVFEDGIPIGADSITPFAVAGVGGGTLSVRAYPKYASKTLYAEAADASETGINIKNGTLTINSGPVTIN